MSSYARANLRITNEKQKENSHEGITWSEMGKQNVQAKKVYYNRAMDKRFKTKLMKTKGIRLHVQKIAKLNFDPDHPSYT